MSTLQPAITTQTGCAAAPSTVARAPVLQRLLQHELAQHKHGGVVPHSHIRLAQEGSEEGGAAQRAQRAAVVRTPPHQQQQH